MKDNDRPVPAGFSWTTWAILGFLAVTAYVLLTEHPAHFVSFLPFVLLLACPLMHLFHHGHHGHGADTGLNSTPTENGTDSTNTSGHQHRHG